MPPPILIRNVYRRGQLSGPQAWSQHPALRQLRVTQVEADGRVCVGTLIRGGLSSVRPDGSGEEFMALPDRSVTNLCFGGSDMRTVHATLSTTGQLVRLRWPRSGLKLNFQDVARC